MIKTLIIKIFSARIAAQLKRDANNAVRDQAIIFRQLLAKRKNTQFGKDHQFSKIQTQAQFAEHVPARDYESLKNYFDQIIEGKSNVLWPGRPKYFAKTSGTTSGVKYIPITKDSLPNHIKTARNSLLNYVHLAKLHDIFRGKLIFLSGSPALTDTNGIATGRLSGIVNHEIPYWAKANKKPSYQTNLIKDWETKLDHIVDETIEADLRLITGIPPWVQMYYERLLARSDKNSIKDLFPNYALFVYGGVNYAPYKSALNALAGSGVLTMETYPASEGFIAFQNELDDPSLLLNTNSGIYFEFIPVDQINEKNPDRIWLENVKLNQDYAIILNNNAGLWGYNIGDTIRFTSLKPYKIVVTGRIKHFISAFGEHVIAKEVETAIDFAIANHPAEVKEFTVAPQINVPSDQLPYHEWFIEFGSRPISIEGFRDSINRSLMEQNIYYKDLIDGAILTKPKLTILKDGAFKEYMQSIGKLGGQNKVPHLSNDRQIADKLNALKLKNQ